MAYKDLREFIGRLEKEGELKRVTKEVDWNIELGTVMIKIFGMNGPAILFENVKGSKFPLLSGAMLTDKRYALGIKTSASDKRTLIKKVLEAIKNPVAPIMVKNGTCKENIDKGDDIDLYKFPAPRWHNLDGGRYIGTLGVVITRDPETKIRNMGIYRQQLHGKNKVGLLATQQVGQMFQKYKALNKLMPIATAIGVDPAILVAACCQIAYGQDELEVAGALRGEPVELVKCETVDLEVPANAEVVLEGEVTPDENQWEIEGPFGEYPGYYAGVTMKRPVINLTAVTYRDKPILQGTMPHKPPNEETTLRNISHTAGTHNKLLRYGIPGFKEVYLTDMGCANHVTIASLDRHYHGGNARQLIEAIWAACPVSKWVIVVDDDIDIFDRGQVEWALATRVQPHRDIVITSNSRPGSDLDPSIHPDERPYPFTKSSKIGIDATVHFKGFEFPPMTKPTSEEMDEVEKKWKQYGL